MTAPTEQTSADAVNTELDPPEVRRREVVLVTGPRLSGATSVLTALRDRMPEHEFVDGLSGGDAPTAVVFVVSAAAVLTESDCAAVISATNRTDAVVAVVSKIDAYRNWREVMAADRILLAGRAPRYASMPWVGAAAAPDLGQPCVDDLAAMLAGLLADAGLPRRNRLRAWESHLESLNGRIDECAGPLGRVRALLSERDAIIRGRRVTRTERTIAVRGQTRQARVELGYLARHRCTPVRTELAGVVSRLNRSDLRGFEAHVRERIRGVTAEVDLRITEKLAEVAELLGLPAAPALAALPAVETAPPPLRSRRLETQLMTVLGAGFGLGVALVVTRLFAGLAPGATVAGSAAGALVGLAVTAWVVAVRGLLHDRAVLDRWVTDVCTGLRGDLEQRVATRVLATEHALSVAAAERDDRDDATAARRVADIDREVRVHAAQTAVLHDERLPILRRALEAVRGELAASGPPG